jgi:hypothetical protein
VAKLNLQRKKCKIAENLLMSSMEVTYSNAQKNPNDSIMGCHNKQKELEFNTSSTNLHPSISHENGTKLTDHPHSSCS